MCRPEDLQLGLEIQIPAQAGQVGSLKLNDATFFTARVRLLYCEHPLERKTSTLHDLSGQFDARFQTFQTGRKFLERVHLHIWAFAAVAVFVGYKIELFTG